MRIAKFLILLPLLATCVRLRSSTLYPEKVLSLPIGEDKASFPKQGGIYHEIPSRVGVYQDWVAFAEPSQRTIRLYRSGKPVFSLRGGEKRTDSKGLEALRIPGRISMGKNDDFFVENYLPPESEARNAAARGGYKILHFDFKGRLLHTIGRKGFAELAFENILWFDTDTRGHLWVLYRYLDELHLDRYEGNQLAFEYRQADCEAVALDKKQIEMLKDKNSVAHCEYIYPFYSGDRILLTARVDRIDPESEKKQLMLAYRIVKVKTLSGDKVYTVFSRLSNAEDHPYLPQGSDGVGIWQSVENHRIRISRYSFDGDLRNALVIEPTGRPTEWRQIWQTLAGEVYGIRIFADRFEVYHFR